MDRLSDFLSQHEETGGEVIAPTLTQGISIRDLSFGYEDEKEILHHINLDFSPGKKYAIVGSSGLGKTTLSSKVYLYLTIPSIIMLRSIKTSRTTMCSLPLSGQVFPG